MLSEKGLPESGLTHPPTHSSIPPSVRPSMHSSINLHQSVNKSISRSTNHEDRNRPSMTHIYRNHDYTLTEGSDWNPSSGIESEDLLFTFRWASFPHCWEQQIRTWQVLVKAIHFLLKAIQHQIWPREKLVSKSRPPNVTAKRKGQMMCRSNTFGKFRVAQRA